MAVSGRGLFLLSRIEVGMMHVVLFAIFYFWNRIFCVVGVGRLSLYACTCCVTSSQRVCSDLE